MRSAKIGRVGHGDACFINRSGGGFAIGTAAGLDQNDVNRCFDVVGIHIDSEPVTGMQERIAYRLAVFAAKLIFASRRKRSTLLDEIWRSRSSSANLRSVPSTDWTFTLVESSQTGMAT